MSIKDWHGTVSPQQRRKGGLESLQVTTKGHYFKSTKAFLSSYSGVNNKTPHNP